MYTSTSRQVLSWFLRKRKSWIKLGRELVHKRLVLVRIATLLMLTYMLFFRRRSHPTTIPAPPDQLVVPGKGQDILEFARTHGKRHNLPVYVFYKARSGQLNNQLTSFFNALAIAKTSNATLVAPFVFYGSESYTDFRKHRGLLFRLSEAFEMHVYQSFLKFLGLYCERDELLGDYLDEELLRSAQPVVSIMKFRQSKAGAYLRTFPHVLARRGDAPFYYMTFGKQSLNQQNVNMRSEFLVEDPYASTQKPASRRQLDCNFNISDYFKGLPYHAGVNGNFLFLSKLYRSHSLNCTSTYPYWLKLRKFVQPRVEIRELVHKALIYWGRVMTVHLRFFPYDEDKFTADRFCDMFLTRFRETLPFVSRLYIAYSVSSKESVKIVSQLRRSLGKDKIVTAMDYGNLREMGPAFNKRYSAPLLDMWTGVNSDYFVGRMGSSLSWNVVFWREAFRHFSSPTNHFYRLQDFSKAGEQNPTDIGEF